METPKEEGSAMSLISATPTPQAPPVYDPVVVDRDTRRLGFLQHRGAGAVEAFDVCARSIGVFEGERAAVVAVWRQAHGQVQP
jgi:hypothetical protein